MRTVRSSGRLLGGGICPRGGCLVPVGCVSGLGGVCLGGVSGSGGVWSRGVCVWSLGCLLWGVSGPGRVCLVPGGVCSWGECLVPRGSTPGDCGIQPCTEADTPSPREQTDACKSITFATPLWTVKIGKLLRYFSSAAHF